MAYRSRLYETRFVFLPVGMSADKDIFDLFSFAFDFAVRIGHEEEFRAIGGRDRDFAAGESQEPGGVRAIVFLFFRSSFLVFFGVRESKVSCGS